MLHASVLTRTANSRDNLGKIPEYLFWVSTWTWAHGGRDARENRRQIIIWVMSREGDCAGGHQRDADRLRSGRPRLSQDLGRNASPNRALATSPSKSLPLSGGVPRIDILGCLLFALRRHLRRIRRSRDAARTELLALDVVFGEIRLDAVWFAFAGHLFLPCLAGQWRPVRAVPF
jgi:hypothetical protein